MSLSGHWPQVWARTQALDGEPDGLSGCLLSMLAAHLTERGTLVRLVPNQTEDGVAQQEKLCLLGCFTVPRFHFASEQTADVLMRCADSRHERAAAGARRPGSPGKAGHLCKGACDVSAACQRGCCSKNPASCRSCLPATPQCGVLGSQRLRQPSSPCAPQRPGSGKMP